MSSSCTIARGCSPLLHPAEIESIFASGLLYEQRSFFVLERQTRTYDQNRASESFLHEARAVAERFRQGDTLVVRNLEHFNPAIRMRCARLGPRVDVHLYLVPPGGSASFDFHADDRDVCVHLVYGSKDFVTREGGIDTLWELAPGDELTLPMGVLHRAIPKGASCLLSFGVPRQIEYPVPGGLRLPDLGLPPSPADF